jgi:hypothetical protein
LTEVAGKKAAAEAAAKRVNDGRAACDAAEEAYQGAHRRFLERKAKIEQETAFYDSNPHLEEAEKVYHYRRLQDQLWGLDRREYAAAQGAMEKARQQLGREIRVYAETVADAHSAESTWAHARSVLVAYATLASFLTAVLSVAAASWRTRKIIEQTRGDLKDQLAAMALSTTGRGDSAAQDATTAAVTRVAETSESLQRELADTLIQQTAMLETLQQLLQEKPQQEAAATAVVSAAVPETFNYGAAFAPFEQPDIRIGLVLGFAAGLLARHLLSLS